MGYGNDSQAAPEEVEAVTLTLDEGVTLTLEQVHELDARLVAEFSSTEGGEALLAQALDEAEAGDPRLLDSLRLVVHSPVARHAFVRQLDAERDRRDRQLRVAPRCAPVRREHRRGPRGRRRRTTSRARSPGRRSSSDDPDDLAPDDEGRP